MTPSRSTLPAFPFAALDRLLPLAFEEDEGRARITGNSRDTGSGEDTGNNGGTGNGDVTSAATIAADASGRASLLVKQNGVIAGLPLVERVFSYRGVPARVKPLIEEGDAVAAGTVAMILEGPLRGLLTCERILLNFLQRCSGIATATRAFADALAGSPTRLLDTRKTLPGYRLLDKYSVAVGGGKNHRMGLHDMVLVKDNHAEACGSVRAAVDKVAAMYGGKYTVEAEVRTLAELESLLDARVDMVLLDNMDDALLARAVELARSKAPKIKLEASGNMDLERVKRLKGFGLDYISVGSLTHSIKAMDISLDIEGGRT